MLGFKAFVAKSKKPIEQGAMVNGVPSAVVDPNYAAKRGYGIGPDGVPCAVVDFGDRKKAKPVTEKYKGGPDQYTFQWYDHHDNDHIGSHMGEVHDHLVKHDKTVDSDKVHVRAYTHDSQWTNKGLHEHHVEGTKPASQIGGVEIAHLDKALARNKLKQPLHVYSGVRWHPGNVSSKHPEGHIHLPAYTSTSLDKETAHMFAENSHSPDGDRHVIHFHVPKGHTGKYVDHVSGNRGENEFLLPRGTNWKIHPKADSYQHDDHVLHVWHAHPVDSK